MWPRVSQIGNTLCAGLIPRTILGGMLLLNVLIYVSFYFIGLTLCNNVFVINAVVVLVLSYYILFMIFVVLFFRAGYRALRSNIKNIFPFVVMVIVSVLLLAGTIFLMPPHDALLRGFNTRVNDFDLDAIRQWISVGKQDPKQNGWSDFPESRWPQVIIELSPRKVEICSVSSRNCGVKLVWGSGMMGSFGLLVCPEKTAISLDRELQPIQLSEGIYIFCDK
jgi:hypothetical protein